MKRPDSGISWRGNDEAEVRANELVERFLILEADSLREGDFLLAIDERVDADIAEVLIQRPFIVRRFSICRDRHTGCCSFPTTAVLCLTSAAMASRVAIESSRRNAAIERV